MDYYIEGLTAGATKGRPKRVGQWLKYVAVKVIKKYDEVLAVAYRPRHHRQGVHRAGRPSAAARADLAHDRRLEEITGGESRSAATWSMTCRPRTADIAMVFQNYALYPHMKVYENMSFG